MTKSAELQPKERQMLELLAEGASTRVLARKMGYSEGTVRVYLHNVYRTLGVRNRTEAVLWQLRRTQPPAAPVPVAPMPMDESFGDVALREGILAALGVMESFIGPYGRMWEAGVRLKAGPADAQALERRGVARSLWRALLAGDFGYGKRMYDAGAAEHLLADSPSEAVLLGLLLQIGGYSRAADLVIADLARKRKGGRGISTRESELLTYTRDALFQSGDEALGSLYHLAVEARGNAALRQTAMIALCHAYRARKDLERAKATADALWAEAEASRRQLEAMGVRPLGREAAVPRPGKALARQPAAAREKAAVER